MISLKHQEKSDLSSSSKPKQRDVLKSIVLPLFFTLSFFLVSQKDLSAQLPYKSAKEWKALLDQPYPLPSYDVNTFKSRIDDYPFLTGSSSVLDTLYPDLVAPVVDLLKKNTSPSLVWQEFAFLRDDVLFLISLVHTEKELQNLQTLLDASLIQLSKALSDTLVATQLANDLVALENSIKGAKNPAQLVSLRAKQKQLELDAKSYIEKKGKKLQAVKNDIEKVCKGARDLLLPIEELQQRLGEASYIPDLSEEKRATMVSNRAIIQNIYERTFLLYKRAFLWEVKIPKS